MQTPIRCCILQHLIWVYTVCSGMSVPIPTVAMVYLKTFHICLTEWSFSWLLYIWMHPSFWHLALWAKISANILKYFSYFFPEEQALTHHENCLLRRQFTWSVKVYFLKKKKKKNIINLSSAELALETVVKVKLKNMPWCILCFGDVQHDNTNIINNNQKCM